MKIPFTKMHGCGNDYIYINCFEHTIDDPNTLSQHISDRHFGIGGDGIVLICPSDIADAKMRMFNIDGSEGKMCGNAIRCVAKYVYDNNIATKEVLTIDTLSGVKTIELYIENGKMNSAKVDMGKAILEPALIPVQSKETNPLINFPLQVEDKTYHITTVSMGNPHCVIFVEDPMLVDLPLIGPKFEQHSFFPESVNTEFISVENRKTIHMRVWERGSGETLACGTGACAAVVAAVLNGNCDKDSDITVKLLGGELIIRYTDEGVYMTGPAVSVFDGEIDV
ncbi:diaminopimelate epimerase [Psychrobacillus psychrodurans]|uniref:diaminopimelate epimerase n=1 Tax=Psychrobacillus psychrodurans TaxID=126157 RepID=UPI0008E11CE5|nr:diaminopimelate epimerase [Psychrobacillus psychrodurans]MCZ8540576.1 diaminopimelate epimerase [Psychrobacillus psychrodurans]SFM67183.1 carbamoyl-phosphate synthase large subunit [Psychrobacillus psychrodurans]